MNEPGAEAAKVDSEAGAAAVALEHASRLYGSFVALRDVSLTLEAGASVVLLGDNGAGKSTLLKLVSGLAQPSYGSVRVFGEPPQQRRGSIGTMGHQPMLYDDLTGTENLMYFAALHGLATHRGDLQAIAAAALKDVALEPGLKRRVGEYSQGMRQRASLARVLMTDPELLLLDEPFSNLDVASGRAMVERLLRWTADRRSRTLLLTTHQAELARPLARTTITLHSGSVASVAEAGAR